MARLSNDLRIHKLTNISKGGVAIQAKDDDQQIAQIKAALETTVEFREPRAKLPKLIIYDLPSEDSPDEVKERIYNQNFRDLSITKHGNTKLIFKTGPRDSEVCNWVLETTKVIREHFVYAGRVFYQVYSCKVADYQVASLDVINARDSGMSVSTAKHCKTFAGIVAKKATDSGTVPISKRNLYVVTA